MYVLSFSKEPVIGIHTQANESISCPNILLIHIHPNITFQSTPKYSDPKSVIFKFDNQIVSAFFIHNMCSTCSVHLILVTFISSYEASHFAIKKEVDV